MNDVIEAVKYHAVNNPNGIVYNVYDESCDKTTFKVDTLKWNELELYSNRLANYINANTKKREPIVVYGHKSKYMIVCFLACVKAGHAYVPIDISVPKSRTLEIINNINPEIILVADELKDNELNGKKVINKTELEAVLQDEDCYSDIQHNIGPKDIFYIIFTSGSTGSPKGVKITSENLSCFCRWAQNLGGMQDSTQDIRSNNDNKKSDGVQRTGYRFLNQAPFSFDLSVMDIYLSLYTGGTICAITKEVQKNLKLLYVVLNEADINVWVSTPSFADVCLSDKKFSISLLPNLKYFLFCGEILTNTTVEKIQYEFPEAVVVNTYGPTESTVCVTEVVVDKNISGKYSPIPVGVAKKGTWIYVVDEEGNMLPDGKQGEIIIVGDTVSAGYYKDEGQTEKVFGIKNINGKDYRLYRTGDKGYLENGQLFYCGRLDYQIKLHGYRIELEDIENNIIKVGGVKKAVVIPKTENGKAKSLTAYIEYEEEIESEFKTAQKVRNELKQFVPEYMVPKRIKIIESIPLTMNGKVDRKLLQKMIKEERI